MKKRMLVTGLMLALFLTGCGKAPVQDLELVKQTLEQAKQGEAQEYAPQSLAAAEDALAKAQADIQAQQKKFFLGRSYKHTSELIAAAKIASDKAAADAQTARDMAQKEANDLLEKAKTQVEEVRGMLTTAPRGKGSEVDIKVLEGDLSGIESSLAEVGTAISSGKYLLARTQAQAALQGAEGIEAQIQAAIDAQAQAKARKP